MAWENTERALETLAGDINEAHGVMTDRGHLEASAYFLECIADGTLIIGRILQELKKAVRDNRPYVPVRDRH